MMQQNLKSGLCVCVICTLTYYGVELMIWAARCCARLFMGAFLCKLDHVEIDDS